ncbi:MULTISPECIES: nucleoid occlusion protein [Alicyclobacillus]|uniref:Nucleoid occlusion protein n=1 Tax=Alicyclobacillus acidoterrestris (strain ATCC 49025 / DSM 3922 / CIP 106132 / NCIMB 13137 / GD3B) TaxID=1356854 RepID=T0BQM9_ALIAG|nr:MULTISPECIES: nucleoid occlusion protein [Alicyclobacillus]EPZ46338.1 chromosome partitioning protein ParB [Alicyclobacillus acidoterrestris ATCC 49025]UNO48993.1 nucleoid occlusion protein [Alicyclobacillus acidoterrestris]GEO27260.1 nucleoid occlusion protein [Alicyclobacillus acidoterrestris]
MKEAWGRFINLRDSGNTNAQVVQLPVGDIVSNPYQPRTIFNQEAIEELAKTIHTHGVIQPIVVRKKDNQYELIAGERRLRAVRHLGWTTIPAIVREMNDAQTASAALIENLQREGLTPIEEAVAYQQLLELHGLTQESLAQRLGKGQSTIANKLRLLNLPEAVQTALLTKSITERHARALLAIPTEEVQIELLQECIDKGWNVKQMEERVKAKLAGFQQEGQKRGRPRRRGLSKDVRLAVNTIRQSLEMIESTGLTVNYEEADEEEYYQFTIRVPKQKIAPAPQAE